MSSTLASILDKHRHNTLLNAAAPALMMQHALDFSADEPAMPLDERLIATAVEALEAGQTHYVDVPGIGPLREAIATFLNAAAGTAFQKTNIVVTAGLQEARFLTLQMIGERFGRIGVPAVVHPGVLRALGVRPLALERIAVDDSATLLPTVDNLRSTLAGGCRLLYLETPSRLTGATYSAADRAAIAALVAQHDAALIVDEGAAVWTADGHTRSLAAQPDLAGRVALIGEAYPGMGLASWFISYLAAPEDWIAPMQSQKQIMAICTSTASQYAALEAGKLFAEAHPQHVQALHDARARLAEQARAAGLTVLEGQAATLLAVRAPAERTAPALAALQQAGIAITDGRDFGAPDVLRLSVTPGAAAEAVFNHFA
ncbi:MAG: pyridoxal phosphate-dependent aminotransferase [Anaerolineae bacterium]|jgi:aspartate/methionine/tyrosine aminotransferase|nr:pyridoxal phosphate-dependent aminotransferase [Anaerolineae bacterium]